MSHPNAKPLPFTAYAIFNDATGECDCNEVTTHPIEFDIIDGFTEHKVRVVAEEVAARTESDVQALVAELKAMADRWSEHQERDRESYGLGVEQGLGDAGFELNEALARFQS